MTERKRLLKLWLPGYHTPSLNVTKGHHWSQYHRLKQEAAGALLCALRASPCGLSIPITTAAVSKLSSIACGKRSPTSCATTRRRTSTSNSGRSGASAKMNKALLLRFGKVKND